MYWPNEPSPYRSYWNSSAFSEFEASIVTDSPTWTLVSETVQLATAADVGVGVTVGIGVAVGVGVTVGIGVGVTVGIGVGVASVTVILPQEAILLDSPPL